MGCEDQMKSPHVRIIDSYGNSDSLIFFSFESNSAVCGRQLFVNID